MLLPVFLCLVCLSLDTTHGAGYSSLHWRMLTNWSYTGATGPENWCSLGYSQCCGTKQSPINLNSRLSSHISNNIRMVNYNAVPRRILLKNNADTVRLEVEPKSPNLLPTTSFEDLPANYVLDNIHFHWGANSAVGSEHTIDGHRYPMEAHFVHRDSKFSSADMASLHPNGVVVLSTLFKLCPRNNPDLIGLIRDLKFVQYAEQTYNDTAPFAVSKILPGLFDGTSYFQYSGSFTTPPCTQGVRWVVFKHTVSISEQQLQAFRALQTRPKEFDPARNHPLVNNYRPLQLRNGRPVFWCDLPFAWE